MAGQNRKYWSTIIYAVDSGHEHEAAACRSDAILRFLFPGALPLEVIRIRTQIHGIDDFPQVVGVNAITATHGYTDYTNYTNYTDYTAYTRYTANPENSTGTEITA